MNRSRPASWVKVMAGSAVLALTLAACGSDSDDTDDAADEPTADETTSQAADDFTNDECAGNTSSADTFKVAGILPLTGNLAFLGPPEVAGVGLAVSDINAAGGVGEAAACQVFLDSGDATDASVANASAQQAISGNASMVLGAASSSVTEQIIDAITAAPIVQISPANTSVALSGRHPFYFRTAPPDGIQGNALGNLISGDGNQRVAFIVFNDSYGVGLRDVVQETIENNGGEVVYGGKGMNQEFPPAQTSFSAEVNGATSANPDAIVVLAFDETKAIIPELANAGFDMSKIYMTDGNTSNYGDEFDAGLLEGAKGTIPGNDPESSFKERLNAWYEFAEGESLGDYSYAAESYDGVILAALAAVKGGDTTPETIQENLAAVSGATDGEECATYADCVALLEDGQEIRYAGPSGIGPFDDENDPSSAFVGIYEYDAENNYSLVTTEEGAK
ncbi:ABC transporter substrate-binding protein [Nocardioides massiliensis]|uniref:Branched-chain amino acid transport system substrate-binding protein n=1 Tax=Nocardioides massiliensis TaxID=1325935 RepID=A0ABT9NSR8_9ACTN|nr:ABC transporter substrate-binding protein [Nocardioides massiliensis]MDP9823465.1 branched-chain amino acid transport system substrate-binding protein [Nocardioides massiliensis]